MASLPPGMADLLNALDDMGRRVDFAVQLAVKRASLVAVREMKTSIRGHNDGRKRGDGRTTDSPIGYPPMNRTGNLRRSIHATRPVQEGFATYSAVAGPGALYSRALELGLANGATYPTVAPASIKLNQTGEILRIYRDTVGHAVRRK